MSEIISDAGLLKSTRARFGTRGFDEVALESNIVRVWDISDLEPPFNYRGGGVISLQQGAVAAQISYCGILAPTTLPPNFRAVIRGIQNLAGQTNVVGIADATSGTFAALGLVQTPVQFSWDQLGRPACLSLLGSNAISLGVSPWSLPSIGAGQVPVMLKWVIAPGQAFLCQTTAVNQQAFTGFYWDEYYIG